MGVSLAWVAVEGLPTSEVLARLALTRNGKTRPYPNEGIAGHDLPRGWYLVGAARCDHRIIHAASMLAVSRGCRAVACSVEEHVNFASCELWVDGEQVWSVQHEGERDVENLSYEGDVPERFLELLSTVEPGTNENLDGHFHMDIPLMLAKEIAGYCHTECNPEIDGTPFEELDDSMQRRQWWKLWR